VSSIDDVDNNILVGTCIGIVVMIICIFALLIKIQKRKLAKEKDIFFKQNGGHILYQQILSKQIDTVIIFTIEDLKKATNSISSCVVSIITMSYSTQEYKCGNVNAVSKEIRKGDVNSRGDTEI